MAANILITAGLYIPVLKRINISRGFKNKNYNVQNDSNISSQAESSNVNEIEMDDVNQGKNDIDMQPQIITVSNEFGKEKPETSGKNINVSKVVQIYKKAETNHGAKQKNAVSKSDAAQKRITIMFFVLILAYIISYTPPVIISIVLYAVDDFSFVTMSKDELAMCVYLTRLVFLNHIVNPFVYGYFDTMFRNGLVNLCKRK